MSTWHGGLPTVDDSFRFPFYGTSTAPGTPRQAPAAAATRQD
ncbi:hypothetical protein [Streptomyces sp. RPT161]|nr:hypothetical protein [Streptomyces sp. RPT161]